MKLDRSAGILLHITSLPGKYGTGTLGDEAYEFVDHIHKGGFRYWQILPVGPVSPSMCWSPYSSISSFAGNELFISIDHLLRENWFKNKISCDEFPEENFCNFDRARRFLRKVVILSFDEFLLHATEEENMEFNRFCLHHNSLWLDDYALYISLVHEFNSFNWLSWKREIAIRDPETITTLNTKLAERILLVKYAQFIFFRQWKRLKDYANSRGIRIIGDIPIYISMESSDAWINSHILDFDKINLQPNKIAGVPPDYFSETGQLWGNPLYKWYSKSGELNEDTYQWWKKRIMHSLSLADIIRIDHFRGFESYWSVEYGEETAVNGEWEHGPGRPFFDRLKKETGALPLIAEDLGLITPEVKDLRDTLQLPGMKILQFAFDFNNKNEYLPHNIDEKNCVVYTGTHDNDTVNGWFYDPEFPEEHRNYVMEYLGMKEWSDFHWRIIREAYATQADLAVVPAQDILGYGREFRMNTPGTIESNWTWKLTKGALTEEMMLKTGRLAGIFSRIPDKEKPDAT